ncbi:MAG: hypothetical protein ACXWZE_16070, partial [Candidatus Binatia bacterium]
MSPHRVVNPTGPAAINQRYYFLLDSANPAAVISLAWTLAKVTGIPRSSHRSPLPNLCARAEARR